MDQLQQHAGWLDEFIRAKGPQDVRPEIFRRWQMFARELRATLEVSAQDQAPTKRGRA